MRNPSDPPENEKHLRERLIGLGEQSHRKSYYPELQKQLEELRKARDELELRVEERTAELARTNKQLEAEIRFRLQAEEQLKATHRRLQDIIEFLPDATFVIDDTGKVVAWNRAIEEMTDWAKESILGKGDYTYALPLYGHRRPCLIDLLRQSDPQIEKTYDFITKRDSALYAESFVPALNGGKGAHLWATASLLYDQEGNVRGAIESFRDISERKEAQTRLQESNRELEAFVYTVSHDLRNPLNSILCNTALLLRDCQANLADDDFELLASVQRQGKRMRALITDLLTLAELRPLSPPDKAISTREVVLEVIESLTPADSGTRKPIQVSTLPDLNIPRSHIYQLFDNLIANAQRYAGPKGYPIEIGGERRGNKVRLYVRDHGPGVPPNERERIFELFYRGSQSSIGGTGVGLATVQKIVRLAEGQAWVEETSGGGATFCVELPVPDADNGTS